MNRQGRIAGVALCVILGGAGAALGAGVVPPDADEVSLARAQVLFKDGNFKDALKTLTKLQEVPVTAAGEVDRFALFMLKAETQMRLADAGMAVTSLGMAHKEAVKLDEKLQAEALELLVRRSPQLTFRPRTGEPGRSFEIIPAAGRKDAFTALWADELDTATKKYAIAKVAKDLPTVAEFARSLELLRAVETAATGKYDTTKEMTEKLKDRVYVVLEADLTAAETQLKTITTNANKTYQTTVNTVAPNGRITGQRKEWHKVGPTGPEVDILKSMQTVHEKLSPVIAQVEEDLGLLPETLAARKARLATLLKNITTLLTTDYNVAVPAPVATRGG